MSLPARLRRSRVLMTVAVLAAVGFAASSSVTASHAVTAQPAAANGANHCSKSAIKVPSCGVLWGLFQQRSRPADARYVGMEKSTGRRFDLVKSYVDWHRHGVFPTGADKRLARHGRTLYYSWNAVNFTTHQGVSYSSIIHGDWDRSVILPEARHLKHFHHKIFLDFGHEFDGYRHRGNGTIAQFRAAYRHIHRVMNQAGVHNVIWSWVSTGFLGNAVRDQGRLAGQQVCRLDRLRPVQPGRLRRAPVAHADAAVRAVLSLDQPSTGMRHKPLLLSEYGSVLSKGVYGWYASIPATLQKLPRLKALMQFSAPTASGCDTTLSHSSAALAGFAKAGRSPAVTGAGG